jgi:hypothetical protein
MSGECEPCKGEIGDVRTVLPNVHERFEEALPFHHALLARKEAENTDLKEIVRAYHGLIRRTRSGWSDLEQEVCRQINKRALAALREAKAPGSGEGAP